VDQPPVQRVCPHCARISYESGRRCPYCGRGFRRSGLLAVAVMLTVFAAVVLGGVFLMLLAAGNEVDRQLDRKVNSVQHQLDSDFNGIRRDVREELDRRLPSPTPGP
jgi:cell division protein FtsX